MMFECRYKLEDELVAFRDRGVPADKAHAGKVEIISGFIMGASRKNCWRIGIALGFAYSHGFRGLTRPKISDREPCKARDAAKAWMADTQNVNRSAARGSLHRLVRCVSH
jgi:hypothetical protein